MERSSVLSFSGSEGKEQQVSPRPSAQNQRAALQSLAGLVQANFYRRSLKLRHGCLAEVMAGIQ